MHFNALLLASLCLASGAPVTNTNVQTQKAMSGVEGAMTNYKQTQDTLNGQLKSNSGHSAQAVINAYVTGADSQIDNAISTVSNALAPFTLGVSKAVGNFLLGPFVQSVTNGAEVLLSNLVGGGIDLVSDEVVGMVTGDYSKLASFASKSNVDTSKLQSLSQKITETYSQSSTKSKSKRDGLSGAITNIKQTVDTLRENLEKKDGHAGKDVVDAAITGLDSQVDNLASTLSHDLNGVTLGISGKIGDFLLGPLFQSITNGAEVIISNVVGGSVDIVSDGTAKLFSKSLSSLESIGKDFKVNTSDMDSLSKVKKQVEDLKSDKKSSKSDKSDKSDSSDKSKRATDADMSGVKGSLTNYKETQDTLNRQLSSHNGHAAQAVINAYVTGADSQIDNAIATVSDALAPFTLGISKAIGDVLLGPFVQSVTNGVEVVISNLIGGGIDTVSDASIEAYSKALSNLSKASSKYGVSSKTVTTLTDAQSKLSKLNTKTT